MKNIFEEVMFKCQSPSNILEIVTLFLNHFFTGIIDRESAVVKKAFRHGWVPEYLEL